MKRILRFLARLYPSSWRRRYGAEFDALLEDATPSAGDAFDVFLGAVKMQMTKWAFGGFLLAGSVAGLLVAGAALMAIPAHYVSQAVVEVRPGDRSSLRVIDDLNQDIFSRESLAVLIEQHNLYPRDRARKSRDEVIDGMKSAMSAHLTTGTTLGAEDALTLRIGFDYPDARVAQQVVSELTAAFIEGNLDSAERHDSRSTFRVLDAPSLPSKPVSPS